jgi:hypothetical protein
VTRLIGTACRKLGAKLVSLGLYLNAIGVYLAPRKRVVAVWHEPGAWTSAHEQPKVTSRGPDGWQ